MNDRTKTETVFYISVNLTLIKNVAQISGLTYGLCCMLSHGSMYVCVQMCLYVSQLLNHLIKDQIHKRFFCLRFKECLVFFLLLLRLSAFFCGLQPTVDNLS